MRVRSAPAAGDRDGRTPLLPGAISGLSTTLGHGALSMTATRPAFLYVLGIDAAEAVTLLHSSEPGAVMIAPASVRVPAGTVKLIVAGAQEAWDWASLIGAGEKAALAGARDEATTRPERFDVQIVEVK